MNRNYCSTPYSWCCILFCLSAAVIFVVVAFVCAVGGFPPQRGVRADFVPNIANRPKRQPGPRMRWADEMINPGEQWLRKVRLLLLGGGIF